LTAAQIALDTAILVLALCVVFCVAFWVLTHRLIDWVFDRIEAAVNRTMERRARLPRDRSKPPRLPRS